ncbi:hypothetical protein [Psychrobacter sp. WY6]|uniref:hypothetical protein n=1 Tax=Psychrobacter sp. WY6 TaxID=2708350 RepID=UPI002022EF89|nr:hypothetical protein [Psychrobacter sp. WY6]
MARTSCGLSGLSVDTALDDVAIKHANYIKYVFANSSPTVFSAHYENRLQIFRALPVAIIHFLVGSVLPIAYQTQITQMYDMV